VAIVSPRRWALVSELAGAPEPALDDVIAHLKPCDLVIVEGYKSAAIPKIETRRRAAARATPLADTDPNVIAIAADYPIEGQRVPAFSLDDAPGIADFVLKAVGAPHRAPAPRTE
jgi:molybdopterin-guanine dinucleotide biosynthesis protein B